MTKKVSGRAILPPESRQGVTAADLSMTRFDDDSRWARLAEKALERLARRGRPFTSTDLVLQVGHPPTPSLLPALFRAAHRRMMIRRDEDAPVGTVWIGAQPEKRRERVGPGPNPSDPRGIPVEDALWQATLDRALLEDIPAEVVLARALRSYLKFDH